MEKVVSTSKNRLLIVVAVFAVIGIFTVIKSTSYLKGDLSTSTYSPDFVVEDVYLDSSSYLTAKLVNIGNGDIGTGVSDDTKDTTVFFYIDDLDDAQWTYNTSTWSEKNFLDNVCNIGQYDACTTIAQPQALTGEHTVKVCIDVLDEVDESNESNNCKTVDFEAEQVEDNSQDGTVLSYYIVPEEATMGLNESYTFTSYAELASGTFQVESMWSISDDDMASIDCDNSTSCEVFTNTKTGSLTLYAKKDNLTAKASVTIYNDTEDEGDSFQNYMYIVPEIETMGQYESTTFTSYVETSTGSVAVSSNWKASDNSIADLINCKESSTCIVTTNSETGTFKLKVEYGQYSDKLEIEVVSDQATSSGRIYIVPDKLTMGLNESYTFTSYAEMTSGTFEVSTDWNIDDENIGSIGQCISTAKCTVSTFDKEGKLYLWANTGNYLAEAIIYIEDETDDSTKDVKEYEDEVITNDVEEENPFSDTDIKTLAGKAAAYLYNKNIIGGFKDGTFRGNNDVNRAEATKFLLLAKGISVKDVSSSQFSDLKEGEWYVKYVVTAANEGIISGYKDGTFKPGNTVTVAEFLKIITKTFDLDTGLSYSYKDVNSEDWFASYVGIAEKYDLFPDKDNGYLEPSSNLTRYDVAVAIYQYMINK